MMCGKGILLYGGSIDVVSGVYSKALSADSRLCMITPFLMAGTSMQKPGLESMLKEAGFQPGLCGIKWTWNEKV